jgi:acetylornithine deacetylase/succinyl-diaminopimelate desuccinylase-like protein
VTNLSEMTLNNSHGSHDTPLPDVVQIARDLIRIDTTNWGAGKAKPEAPAADYVQALLEEVGLDCQRFEAEPGRTNLVARWMGANPALPALLLHGHLDVVPADAADWSVDPFGGEIRDGMLWGRGAVDMKDMDAMIIASVREMIRNGERPERDIVLAFFADEEAGCTLGSQWMVDAHPEVFAGVSHAITEGGGYTIDINGKRAYMLSAGEKGVLWIRMRSKGRAGHASMLNDDNAITTLAAAVVRVGAAEWPLKMTATTVVLRERLLALSGAEDTIGMEALVESTGMSSASITATLRNVGNVTMLSAGYKENVIPERASAMIDVRFLPGERDAVLAHLHELAGPDIEFEIEMDLIAMESPVDGPIVDALNASIGRLDPGAEVVPHLVPGGTDNKGLSRIGIVGYGFVPLRLPIDLEYPALFHGVDERIPLDALTHGQAVLTDLIRTY